MGKATGVGTIVFGAILMLLGVGAYFSGEASTQTQSGQIGIVFAIMIGLFAILGGMSARDKEAKKAQQAAAQPQYQQPVYPAGPVPVQPQYQQQPYQQPQYQQPIPPPPDEAPQNSRPMFCPNCGKPAEGQFCKYCGAKIV